MPFKRLLSLMLDWRVLRDFALGIPRAIMINASGLPHIAGS